MTAILPEREARVCYASAMARLDVRRRPLRPGRVDPDSVVSLPTTSLTLSREQACRLSPTTPSTSSFPHATSPAGSTSTKRRADLSRMLDAGIVRRDVRDGFYLYRMTFHDEHGTCG